MNDRNRQPREDDLVLGGNNPSPINGLVLGGIEGLKLQFNNADSEDKKIAILKQASLYNQVGEDWLLDIVATENNKIQWLAAVLLSNTSNEVHKGLLLEYFAEFIPNNVEKWNEYKQVFPDLKINLSKINLSNTKLQGIDLSRVNLNEADFSDCQYPKMGIIFRNSNLENIDFMFSKLQGVIFDNVNLKGADFRGCNLTEVDFTGLDVRGANFARCTFGNNNLDKANTEGAKFSSADSPRFRPIGLDTYKLKGALFDDQHYYEPGAE